MRVTGPLLKVLALLLADGCAEQYGLDLIRASGLKSGTLYPLLDRLQREGWVTSRWEPSTEGPRRRYYRIVGHHVGDAHNLLAEYGIGRLSWA